MEKKNQPIWFLYACALLFGFSKTTAALTQMMGLSVQAYLLLTAALIFVLLIVVYLPVKLLAGTGRWNSWGWEYERKMTLTEWVFLVLLMEVLLCVRLYGTPAGISVEGQFCYVEALAFTEDAGYGFGAGELYIRFLHLCMRIFGESYAAFWGNMILQVVGAMFLFLAVHGLTGTVSACCAVLGVACVPAFHYTTYMAEPQSMLFCLYCLVLFLGSCCLNQIRLRRKKGNIWGTVCLLGLLNGFAAALSIQLAGILLLAEAELFFILKGTKKNAKAVLVCAVCAAAGFGLFFLAEFFLGPDRGTFLQGLNFFWTRWHELEHDRIYDALLHSPALGDYWAVVPLYLFSFLALFGTFRTTRKSGVIWIFPSVYALVINTFGQAPYQEQAIFFALLGVMAGTGLTQMFSAAESKKKAAAEEMIQEDGAALEDGFDTVEEPVPEDEFDAVEQPEEENPIAKEESQKSMMQLSEGNVTWKACPDREGERKIKPGEYLDNPLPVPKRHVKKEMDYGFEPEPDQMFFEIPVSDEDDFDIS